MDLAKFADILLNKSIFFARGDKLGDPFEGSLSQLESDARRSRIKLAESINAGAIASEELVAKCEAAESQQYWDSHVHKMFVSCWHMSDCESTAMWGLYAQADGSVCIQGTLEGIQERLPAYARGGVDVRYEEFGTLRRSGIFIPLRNKRKSYEHEKEFRFIVDGENDDVANQATDYGLSVPLSSLDFIENIYIRPTSPPWFRVVVEQLVGTVVPECPISVRKSSLDDPAMFKLFYG